jgi:hypothetical protein
VIPAEDGTPSAGAQIVAQYVELNNDDTVRGRAYAALDTSGARLTLAGVDGGAGGSGAIELRFSNSGASTATVAVNGVPFPVALPSAGNSPTWRHTHWRVARIENVTLQAGPTNTIEITATGSFPNISVDEITVTRPDEIALAVAHREALQLSPADRAALVAYLLQLDGQFEDNPGFELFADGFESGHTGAWSSTSP